VITSQNAKFVSGQYGETTVNAEVVSKYISDLKEVDVNAICYDANGTIVGGGMDFLALLPGGGSAGVSVHVIVSGTPQSCDVFAAPSFMSIAQSGQWFRILAP
jgi:hypothetical protein